MAGNDISALDFVFERLIGHAFAEGIDFFDFDISNEDEGHHPTQDFSILSLIWWGWEYS